MIDKEFWKNKKVFITGHTGFKGTWLSKWLLLLGAEVSGYALTPPTEVNLFKLLKMDGQLSAGSYLGDVRDREHLEKALGEMQPEIVIHMAAQPIVRDSYKMPVYTYETNVMGTVNILDALRFVPSVKSFVNVTTDKVYFNAEKSEGYRETDYLCGYDPYSNSKSCSELVTYSYKNSFFHAADVPAISTARSGNVIGGGDFANDRIIPDCVRAVQNRTEIIVRNPDSIRPYQHVLDCLGGYLLLAETQYKNKSMESSYNFGPDITDCIKTSDLVELFCDLWNAEAAKSGKSDYRQHWLVKPDGGPHESTFLRLDCTKAKERLKWNPVWDIKTAVSKVVEWTDCYLSSDNIDQCMEMQIDEFMRKYGG